MRSGPLVGLALVAGAAPTAPALGQRLTAAEVGAGGVVVAARQVLVGAEVGAAYRPGSQSRLALAVAAGTQDGAWATRAQLTAQFLVTPAARAGAGLYGGLGVAVASRRGSEGYLAVVLGIEGVPGRRSGWYAELGVAGGVRAAAGWRVRRFPGWWRP